MNDTSTPARRSSLTRKLTFRFTLLAVLPLTLVALFSYQQARKSLTVDAHRQLRHDTSAKTAFFLNWFDYRFQDLEAQADNEHNSELLKLLRDGLRQSGTTAADYVKSFDWTRTVTDRQNDLVSLLHRYDYIYDLFLIDGDGNILFTVVRESDLGTNLFNGPLAGTRFAASVKYSLQTGQANFSDIERYAPSNYRLDGFLTAPLLDNTGEKIGVFAIQVKMDRVFEIMATNSRDGNSLKYYVIGEDGRLRTALNGEDEILKRSIDTEQVTRWREERDADGMHENGNHEQVLEYSGPDGQQVLGLHHDLSLPGVNWLLISEVDRNDALAAISGLGRTMFILVVIAGVLVAGAAAYEARSISYPIVRLSDASEAVAAGRTDERVEVTSDDEIGQLALSFNHMLSTRDHYEAELRLSTQLAEDALSDLEDQKFALDEHSIVAITDVKGTIIFVNQKFIDISGYAREELIGQNHRILKSGLHDHLFFKEMFQSIANGEVWHGEICNRDKAGYLYWVDTTIAPLLDKDGKPRRYIAIRTDITAAKENEENLTEANVRATKTFADLEDARESAEAATQAKSEFLANMSHEIRTPMNGVIGMTDLLLDSGLTREQHKFARTVKSSAESLLSLLNDILDFSKIEAGKLELEPIDFDIGPMLDEFGTAIAFKAHEKGLELICPADAVQDKWFKADPGRIRQVLTNLVGNAIKFTEQGEVAVHCTVKEKENGRSLVRIEIVDTGIGLSDEQIARLFARFSQADGSTTRKYGGTGLGLVISKQLVEMMGGEIGVVSDTDKGSTFWFTMNLANTEEQPPEPALADLLDQKILVVDDNATNRELLEQLLTNWQAKHELVDSGESALEALRTAYTKGHPYTIAIVDMQMPGMDGMQLGTAIVGDTNLEGTQLLMLSSQGQRGDAEKLKASGFAGYLSKPIVQSELYNALLQIAGIHRSEPVLVTRHTTRELPQFDGRVLVVEDNATNQLVAKSMLRKFGVNIELAANGQEALDALEQHSYDLVFMDCQMPVMDGYEASRRIRDPESSVKNHVIPVVAMTANAMQGDRELCLDAGMDDYITKPISSSALSSILTNYLSECAVGSQQS